MTIPHDEEHRFLNWQRSRGHCLAWALHLDTVGAPYDLVHVPGESAGWTIYKHCWNGGPMGGWCCGARA